MNGGFTTKCFNIEKGARQGDLNSTYLFIFAMEIFFSFIKNDSWIKGIKKILTMLFFMRYMPMIQRFLPRI